MKTFWKILFLFLFVCFSAISYGSHGILGANLGCTVKCSDSLLLDIKEITLSSSLNEPFDKSAWHFGDSILQIEIGSKLIPFRYIYGANSGILRIFRYGDYELSFIVSQSLKGDTITLTSLPEGKVEYRKSVGLPIWHFSDEVNTIARVRTPHEDELSAAALINILNRSQKNVEIVLGKISGDTIFIKIPQSEYLTQRMGSTGAHEFMLTTIFTLTELKNVHAVSFDFIEGDHASLGIYTRSKYGGADLFIFPILKNLN